MRFGFSLIMRGHEATPDTFVAMAQKSEQLGLDALWCSAHVIIPPQVKSGYVMIPGLKHPEHWKERYWEPFTVLSYLAASTSRIRLGTSVTVLPMHNPFEIAKQVAQLDQLSGGRFVFGIGVGWFEEEFEVLGQDYHNRGRRTDDAIDLMKKLWTEEPVTHEGPYYRVTNGYFSPKPVASPHPPIWIGGHSEAALRRSARVADGWQPVRLNPEEYRAKRDRLTTLLSEHDRTLDDIELGFKTRISFQPEPPAEGQGATEGRPGDIIDALRRYRDMGVCDFVLDYAPESLALATDTMERFVQEVRPHLE